MKRIRGNISKDGQVILRDVEISFTNPTNAWSGLKEWSGSIALPPGERLELGGRYFVELADGRSGEIVTIQKTRSRSSSPEAVDFIGSGPLA